MKAGIITFHRAHNLGAILQAYALCSYLNEEICDAELIDFYPNNAIPHRQTPARRVLRAAKRLLGGKPYRDRLEKERRMLRFMEHYRVSARTYYGDGELAADPPAYDVLISGGDQILNQSLSGDSESYYLTFGGDVRKMSYASSFGRAPIPEREQALVRRALAQFDHLACRESSGAEIIETLTGKPAQVVVDPVFLLEKRQWRAVSAGRSGGAPYLFVYAMEDTEQLRLAVETAKEALGLDVVTVRGKRMDCGFGGQVDDACGPAEFLSYLDNAAAVVTNSFHGMAFSILFEKPFYAVAHSERNARIEDLLRLVHADTQLIGWENCGDEIRAIDGAAARAALEQSIQISKAYLRCAVRGGDWACRALDASRVRTIENHVKTRRCFYCRACVQICPAGAIDVIGDRFGSRYPKIDPTRCVSCGLCAAACPLTSPCAVSAAETGLAARIDDTSALAQSTSGGVFTALSDRMLESGGLVAGAVFDAAWQCRHILASTQAQRDRMRGAKYVQSDTGDVYAGVRDALRQGRPVLFSGTPCQVAGLKGFLDRQKTDRTQLLLVDIICHGVAPQAFFDAHIADLRRRFGPVTDYRFRSKEGGWHGSNVRVAFESGKTLLNGTDANGYAELYFRSLLMRESCLRCPYSSLSRAGDITIGDFWGIDRLTSDFSDEKGVSCVFANTDRGRAFLESVAPRVTMRAYAVEDCVQPNLKHAAAAGPDTALFRADFEKRGFRYCVQHYTDCSPAGYLGRRYRRVKRKLRRLLGR